MLSKRDLLYKLKSEYQTDVDEYNQYIKNYHTLENQIQRQRADGAKSQFMIESLEKQLAELREFFKSDKFQQLEKKITLAEDQISNLKMELNEHSDSDSPIFPNHRQS